MTASEGESQIWPEDLPREVVVQLARAKLSELTKKIFGKKSDKHKQADEQNAVLAASADSGSTEKDKKKSSHLKRIK